MYVSGGQLCLVSFLTSMLDGDEWLIHAPADLTSEKRRGNPLDRRLGGRQSPYGRFWRRENLLSLQRFELRNIEPLAGRYTGA